MPRPSRIDEQRNRLLPLVAKAFGELGYRCATTALLAKRCRVRENILYRLWKDKKEMFLASLDSLFERRRTELEKAISQAEGRGTRAERMIDHVAKRYGDDRLARVIFAGLAETDDPEIRQALARMYGKYQSFVQREIQAHRKQRAVRNGPDIGMSALALIGLATTLNVYSEVGVIPRNARKGLYDRAFSTMGPLFLGRSNG